MAIIPVGWNGVRFEGMRCSVVDSTGALAGEPLGIPDLTEPPGSSVGLDAGDATAGAADSLNTK